MSPSLDTQSLDEIRARNQRFYGIPNEAREYAEDQSAVYCENCFAVFYPQDDVLGLGHDCPVDRDEAAPVVAATEPMLEAEIAANEEYIHLRYVRGYFLTDRVAPGLGDHWATTRFGNYTLGWDQRTPSANATIGDRTVVLIGRAFHLVLNTADLEQIVGQIARSRQLGREAYDRELYELSGRYIVIDHGPDGTYLQTDAVGMRSAYYAKTGGTVTSHAGLTAQIIGDDSPSAFGAKDWFRAAKAPSHPGRATEYTGVQVVTPNTELDVATNDLRRVGPTPRGADRPVHEVAAELVPLLQAQIGALVEQGRPLVSLTAGLDSRTTLALSYPFRKDMIYFSHVTYRGDQTSPSEPDMLLARQICEDYGLDYRVVTITGMLTGGPLNAVIRGNSRRIHAPSIAAEYRDQLPPDSVHLRSNIYEIGRSFFRNAATKELPELTAEEFAKRIIRVRAHESFQAGVEAFDDWLVAAKFSDVEGYDPYDLYYWELRMSRWLPAHITESDIAHDTYTVVNSRRILELFLSVSLEDRLSAKLFDVIIGMTWPELFKYPVNGEYRSVPEGVEPSGLSDDELDDRGMYRCACGAAVYPGGDGAPHCELDIDRR